MPLLAGFIVPHPPLIVPEVGRGKEREIAQTVQSFHAIAAELAALAPETIVVISPHSTLYADYIHISPGTSASGSLRQFGAPKEYKTAYDSALVSEISKLCEQSDFPAGTLGEKDPALDHATLVPLHFIKQYLSNFKLVRIAISGLSRQEHYEFGMLLSKAIEKSGRKVVIVASGDLSHKLTHDGPYGYSPDGPKLDAELVKIMKSGDFGAFLDLDEALCENAAECGLRGFVMMSGAFDKKAVTPRFYSYEGPFGVGYAVASFHAFGIDDSRDYLSRFKENSLRKIQTIRDGEDAYTRLARETLEGYVSTGRLPAVPADLADDMQNRRAGVFVSIKKHGELRGCIGTTSPVRESIALEIMHNAVAAGAEDPRFSPVRQGELTSLVYSVDVLAPAEPVTDRSKLDVKRYGVIVSKGSRRGLLLPNLDGVDSVDKQLQIACQKAGISPDENFDVSRFEVVRHT